MGPSGKGIEEHCQRSKGREMAATKKRGKKITPTCRCNVLPPPAHRLLQHHRRCHRLWRGVGGEPLRGVGGEALKPNNSLSKCCSVATL